MTSPQKNNKAETASLQSSSLTPKWTINTKRRPYLWGPNRMRFFRHLINLRLLFFLIVAAASLITGAVVCGLSLRAVHIAVVPCFVAFILLFRKDIFKRIRWYHFLYFGLLTAAVAAYLVSLAHFIPEIRVRWLEFPVAIWFLISIHIVVLLIDRIINAILSVPFNLGRNIQRQRKFLFPKTILRILCVLAIAGPYLLAVFMVHWVKFADNIDPRQELGADFQQVRFQSTDEIKLEGWFIPAASLYRGRPALESLSNSTVIIVPGRGTTKACFLSYAMTLSENGHNVLLFDLRGQGASSGHTCSFGLLEANDVLGAVRYLKQFHQQASYYIFALGISDGASAVIGAAACDERIRAVVIDSVNAQLGSLPERLKRSLPRPADVYVHKATLLFASAILGRNLFHQPDINNKIAQISPRPVLIFHGAADRISDPKSAEKLYATAKKPKKLCMVPNAGHAQVLLYTRERYINEISEAFALGMLN